MYKMPTILLLWGFKIAIVGIYIIYDYEECIEVNGERMNNKFMLASV